MRAKSQFWGGGDGLHSSPGRNFCLCLALLGAHAACGEAVADRDLQAVGFFVVVVVVVLLLLFTL